MKNKKLKYVVVSLLLFVFLFPLNIFSLDDIFRDEEPAKIKVGEEMKALNEKYSQKKRVETIKKQISFLKSVLKDSGKENEDILLALEEVLDFAGGIKNRIERRINEKERAQGFDSGKNVRNVAIQNSLRQIASLAEACYTIERGYAEFRELTKDSDHSDHLIYRRAVEKINERSDSYADREGEDNVVIHFSDEESPREYCAYSNLVETGEVFCVDSSGDARVEESVVCDSNNLSCAPTDIIFSDDPCCFDFEN